jgi:peptide/nickel transport system ATP-binding protein
MMTEARQQPVISVRDLRKHFESGSDGFFQQLLGLAEPTVTRAVDGVSFDVAKGEIVGLVGESGCGKSTTAKLISGLLEPTSGTLRFNGTAIKDMSDAELDRFEKSSQMIFQNPYESLNPSFTVRRYLAEPLIAHGVRSSEEVDNRIDEVLDLMGMNPAEYADKYSHELSGGEKQRVHIASALVLDPEVLICDEPTSMLDVSIRTNILEEISNINERLGVTVFYISHDIATTAYLCDRIFVMYAGEIVEAGTAEQIVSDPKHPYTEMLLSAVPSADPASNRPRVEGGEGEAATEVVEADVTGCKFAPRCPEAMDICTAEHPDLIDREGADRPTACHLFDPVAEAGDQETEPPSS